MGELITHNRLNLLFIPKDNKGCGFYRMMVPANEIKRQDLANVMVLDKINEQSAGWANVIIVQRVTDPQFYEIVEKLQSMGKKVIYEIDDFLNSVSPFNPSFDFWSPMGQNMGRALKIMQKCDAVQVTTERLQKEYILWNPHVEPLGNYLDHSLWDQPAWTAVHWTDYYKKKNDGTIRIGWAGAGSHYHDLQLIEKVMTDICAKYPNVHFVLMGYHGTSKRGPNLFQKISDTACRHCNAEGQLEKVPGIDLLYYPSKLKECAFDIGLAPLIETSFNQGKSDLRIKEYAALGIPVVATRMKPYSESIKEGYTGFLASTAKEWYDSLEVLIKDKLLRERMGRNNYRWYRQNTIDKHIHEWIAFYNRISSMKFKW
jgi:hypothetical protein